MGESITGRAAIDLLVVTKFPDWGPLRAVMSAGPAPAAKLVASSVSSAGWLVRHWTPWFVLVPNNGSVRAVSTFIGGTVLPQAYFVVSQHSTAFSKSVDP